MAVHYGGKGPGHIARSIGGFNPRSLFAGGVKGVVFDLSDLSTVFSDTAGTTPAVIDGTIARINDKSGNGANATQATGINQPLLKATGSRYRVLFDGSNDILQTAAIDMSAGDEITIVLGLNKTSDAATQVVMENTTGVGSFRVYIPAAGTGYVHGMTGTASTDTTATGFAAPATSVVTGLGKIGTDTNIIRVNGVQRTTNVADLGTGNMGNFALSLGSRVGSFPFSGSIFALIIINRLLTAAEITLAENWVNSRTGAY